VEQEEIKPPNGMRYGFWIENLQKEAIDQSNKRTEHCAGKSQYYAGQKWYHKIPLIELGRN